MIDDICIINSFTKTKVSAVFHSCVNIRRSVDDVLPRIIELYMET